jgi:UDP-2-acetamido-2,6-beta-L-arabino-hexul-4-ose reductase
MRPGPTMTSTPRTILITGAHGAIGRYTALHYRHRRGWTVLSADRRLFGDAERLREAVAAADVVLHLAGVNRASDDELAQANPAIARTLVAALAATGSKATLLYASSLHEGGDSVYGQSKRQAGDILAAWASKAGARFVRLLLPHVYCEFTRPHYNSGIATFCHAVASGSAARILTDGEIYPLHAGEVCELFDQQLAATGSETVAPLGEAWRMSDMLKTIRDMHDQYRAGMTVPDLREPRRLNLFNTYRTHLYPDGFPVHPVLHADARGNLFEGVRELNGGQAFVSRTVPGVTRGNHFHFRKVERFCVIEGEAVIEMRPADSDQVTSYRVSGREPCFIDMPTLWTHNITNSGPGELLTMFWSHEIFNPEAPDTYAMAV